MKFALDDKYPIETEEQLVKAAEYFEKNLSRFHPEERVKIACNIDSQSANLKVNLNHGWITNYTRMKKSAALSPSFKQSMKLRKEACVRHKVELPKIEGLNNSPSPEAIIDEIIKMGEHNEENHVNTTDILNTVVEFDKKAGLEYLYDQQIIDPYLTVFGDINNPEFDSVKLAGDATQYDLLRASRDQDKLAAIEDKLGKEFASDFHKNPIISLEKLGSPEKTVLSIITR